MTERLSPVDVAFLHFEESTTHMHVGAVGIFETPESGFDYDTLTMLIRERMALVPRYRQKVRGVPGNIAAPVWVDDTRFDMSYHVRRSALPRPGSDQQLRELVARLMSRPLDRSRPLWEMYLVEGLSGGRFAIITKTHHAVVDGIGTVDLGAVILDPTPEPRETPKEPWRPAPEPSRFDLLAGAVTDMVARPSQIVDTVRAGITDIQNTVEKVALTALGAVSIARTAARSAPGSPLNVQIGSQRRYATLRTDLDDYRRVRKAFGGTVNDVVLATVAGGLRSWLLTRGEQPGWTEAVRALVPVSVRAPQAAERLGNKITPIFVELPIGEPDPLVRLRKISCVTQELKESGQAIGASRLVALSGFAPPTLHALAARLANGFSRRLFNLVISNVPGPQTPLYAAGARLIEAYPVVPLAKGQAVSIGLTSYDGSVCYGLNADRDAMPDLEVLAEALEDSLRELVRHMP
jgi:diacylglycerol O-acyltransferase / wax synthase